MAFASNETLDFESWLHGLPILILWLIVDLSIWFLFNSKVLTLIRALHQKKTYIFPFNWNNLTTSGVILTKDFSTNYWASEVQDLTFENIKQWFHLDLCPPCKQVQTWGLIFTKTVLKFYKLIYRSYHYKINISWLYIDKFMYMVN
jgi:hypothetical protein